MLSQAMLPKQLTAAAHSQKLYIGSKNMQHSHKRHYKEIPTSLLCIYQL